MWNKISVFVASIFQEEEADRATAKWWQYLFGILLLALCGWRVYNGLEEVMDIQFADESAYMRFGLDLFDKLNRDWGPMYCIWYKLLSYITTDTIQLYYLNYALTSVLLVLLLYVFLLRMSVAPVLALLVSFSVLVSDLNVSVWPRISHFCIMLLLAFLVVITYFKKATHRLLLFALVCLIISYARPEFYLSFLGTIALLLLALWCHRKQLNGRDYTWLVIAFVVIGILHFIFRFPSNDFFGYNRGVAAFYQHYAFNFKVRTNSPVDAWLYWEDICKQQFGDCNSMWCVIKTQPMIVIDNTLYNLKNYILTTLVNAYSYIFPMPVFSSGKIKAGIMLLIPLAFMLLLRKRDDRMEVGRQLYQWRWYLLVLLVFIAPTVLSCIVVFPRQHYLFLQMLLVLLLLMAVLQPIFKRIVLSPVLFILFGGCLLLATPNVRQYSFLKVNNDTNSLCNKALVRELAGAYSDKPHTLFTNMPFVRGMLPVSFREVNTIFDKKKHVPFQHYLDSAKIDIVILTPATFRDPHIIFDSSWTQFVRNYPDYGFKKKELSGCETYLLVKEP